MPTPVGEPCLGCEEPIAQGDQGLIMPYGYLGPDGEIAYRMGVEHRECLVLSTVGHLAGQCYCHDGLGTHRERGRATIAWLDRRRIAKTN